MPQVIPAIIAAAAAIADAAATVGAITIAGVTVGEIAVGTLISAGLSYLSSVLLAPKASNFSERGNTVMFRAPTAPADIVYGTTRKSGAILFMATSSETGTQNNKFLHMVIALAGHEVEEIGDVYFGDELIPLNGNGVPIGTNATDPGGGLANFCFVKKHTGAWDQDAEQMLLNAFPSDLTANDRFRGIAYIYARLRWDDDGNKWPQGIPNISAIVKGRKVYDPRDVAQVKEDPSTYVFSNNAALCLTDYIRGCPMYTGAGVVGRPYGIGAPDSAVDWELVESEANICDEVVNILGGSEARYTCDGKIASNVAPTEALAALRSALAGNIAWVGGVWKIFAGAYRLPEITLTDGDMCGSAKNIPRRPERELMNGVKGMFAGPATHYQPTGFPPVTNAAYVAQDNGDEIWRDVEYPFTSTASRAQRIAKIDLERNRQQIVTHRVYKLNDRTLRVSVGAVVAITDSRKGWDAKPFEVTRWALTSQTDDSGNPYLCIAMSFAETAPSVYDWATNDEVPLDDAPDTNFGRPWEVQPAGAPGIAESLYQTRQGGGVKTQVVVSWAASGEGFLLDYVLEYRVSGAETWTTLPATTDTKVVLADVQAGQYDFRVRARNVLGVSSDYSTSEALTVYGLGAAPAQLTSLGIQPLGNIAVLSWAQSPDLDVREGGRVVFRHSIALSGATWDAALEIREAVSGSETSASVPLKAGTYLVRAIDSSGIQGPVTSVSTKQASVNGYSSLAGSPLTEESTFAGTHSGTVAAAGELKLDNVGLWDDIPDLDAVGGNVDDLGGIALAGTYTFANRYNFGAITRVRLTSIIAGTVTSILSNFDDRTANIDDWEDFDGASIAQANAWVEFRQTDTNPSGSPTWTPWMRLDTAEVEAWGVECRAQLRTDDAAYNVSITTLQVKAEKL